MSSDRNSPVHRLIDQLSDHKGQYKTTSEVAEELGVNETTVRRMAKRDDVPGPSKKVKMGKLEVALYTKADLKELREYMSDRHKLIDVGEE